MAYKFNPFTGQLDNIGIATGGSGITSYARSATKVVAASNALDTTDADFTCTGTNDHTVINSAIAALSAIGGTVFLSEGTFNVAAPIVLPSNVTLKSNLRGFGSPVDSYGLGSLPVSGSILKPTAAFSGSAVVLMDNSAHLTQMGGQQIIGISIDGSSLPGGNSVHGIESIGAVAAATLSYCFVYKVGGNGIYANLDGVFNPANTWDVSHTNVSDCGGWGFSFLGTSDCYFSNCRAATNTAGGWLIQDQSNSRFVACHSEWNIGAGWKISFPFVLGYVTLVGCTSEHNDQDGYFFTGALASKVVLSGCRSVGDGRNGGAGGGGYAGLRASANSAFIMGSGVVVETQTSPSCPQYGVSQVSSSNKLALKASYVSGVTANTNDDGSNTQAVLYAPIDVADATKPFAIAMSAALG